MSCVALLLESRHYLILVSLQMFGVIRSFLINRSLLITLVHTMMRLLDEEATCRAGKLRFRNLLYVCWWTFASLTIHCHNKVARVFHFRVPFLLRFIFWN